MLTVAPDPPLLAPARAHVELCGTLVAEIGGRRVEAALPGRKGRQLFACLVMSRHRAMSRDELIDVVWPHDVPADPDGAFSTLLTRLRNALGHEVVVGRSELVLALGDDAWVDWEVVRNGVATAETRLVEDDARAALDVASAALEIACRPILPGVSTPWLEDRRRELFEARAALLETGGHAALALGREHLPLAERRARELIELEPYRESAYALLMETHARRGNLAEALRVFDVLRRLLRDELGLSPSPPLNLLAGRLLEQKESPASLTPAAAAVPAHSPRRALPPAIAAVAERPLAGRGGEVLRVSTEILRSSESRWRVVAVTGEAGAGKTRLVAEVAVRAHTDGYEVLHGRAQRDAVTPYQPFVEALRGHLGRDDAVATELAPVLRPELAELARIVPELRRAVDAASDDTSAASDVRRQRTFTAVGALCETIARQRPLLLILEDLQWADPATLLLLRHVAHTAHCGRVTLLLTIRDDEPLCVELRTLLVDLLRERALHRVPLKELGEHEIAELMTAHGYATPDAATFRAIVKQAGGNPFFVEELARNARDDGDLPDGLRDAVELRLDGLPAAARGVLRIAAAAGASFDVATVARRADAPPAATRQAVRQAVRTGLIVADGSHPERFAFRHGVVRRALLAP